VCKNTEQSDDNGLRQAAATAVTLLMRDEDNENAEAAILVRQRVDNLRNNEGTMNSVTKKLVYEFLLVIAQ
jgi:hypothetical protein